MSRPNRWMMAERLRCRSEAYQAALHLLARFPIEEAIARIHEKMLEHRLERERLIPFEGPIPTSNDGDGTTLSKGG